MAEGLLHLMGTEHYDATSCNVIFVMGWLLSNHAKKRLSKHNFLVKRILVKMDFTQNGLSL